jgi:hypothetical protein
VYIPSAPPAPRDPVEAARIEHTRLRRRLLYGMAEADLEAHLIATIGSIRRTAWGKVDQTRNPYLQIHTQCAALYGSEPTVAAPAGGEDIANAIADTGYWSLMQRVQRDTLGMREMLVRIDLDEQGIALTPVPPDMVTVEVHPRRPNIPVAVREWMPDPDDNSKWIQHLYDPRIPLYAAFDADGNDVSLRVLGGFFGGEAYPWMTPQGAMLPWVVYRAAQTGNAWDAYTGKEIVEGTRWLSAFYTYFGHILRNVAFAQRYALGVVPAGMTTDDEGKMAEVVTDPGALLLLRQLEEFTGQPLISQFNNPVSIAEVMTAIRSYEGDIINAAIGSASVTRASSAVVSAYSLVISRDAQRELQRAYEPLFRRTDLELLGKVSALLGGPTVGWRITYNAIPKDPEEIKSELEHIKAQVEIGTLDRITAYQQLHPGLNRDEATKAVDEIAKINRSYASNS